MKKQRPLGNQPTRTARRVNPKATTEVTRTEPENEDAAIDAELYKQLEAATTRAPLRAGIIQMLSGGYKPKCQEEVVAILRLGTQQRAWLGGDALKLLEAIAWWSHDQKLLESHPCEFMAWVPTLDNCMAQLYSNFLSDGWDPKDFLRTYSSLLSTYVEVATIEELLLVEDSWENHHEKLEKVCLWELGRKMFGFANDSLVNHKIKLAIQSALDETLDVNGVSAGSRILYREVAEAKLDWLDDGWRNFPRMTSMEHLNEPGCMRSHPSRLRLMPGSICIF